jgi:hypothetical protein
MRASDDKKTLDLLPEHDLAGERAPELTKAQKTKIRNVKYCERNNLHAMTVYINAEVLDQFNEWLAAHPGKKRAEVVERLIKTQLLRKR